MRSLPSVALRYTVHPVHMRSLPSVALRYTVHPVHKTLSRRSKLGRLSVSYATLLTSQLKASGDFAHFEDFDLITSLYVIVVLNGDTTFGTNANFLHVVFKAT